MQIVESRQMRTFLKSTFRDGLIQTKSRLIRDPLAVPPSDLRFMPAVRSREATFGGGASARVNSPLAFEDGIGRRFPGVGYGLFPK